MAIAEDFVYITISGLNADYYRNLGYPSGKDVEVKTEHLRRGSKTLVTRICDNCGLITKKKSQEVIRRDRMNGKDLCHRCMYDITVSVDDPAKDSRGESVVRAWLTKRSVRYASQVRRKGLTGLSGRPLLFDFAILDEDNSPVLYVEYDGEGEEKTERRFAYQREHDKRKDRYCEKEGVKLLRISYELPFSEVEALLDRHVSGGSGF